MVICSASRLDCREASNYCAADFEAGKRAFDCLGWRVAVAGKDRPDDAENASRGSKPREVADNELARRRERLDAALAVRRSEQGADGGADRSGVGMAMKLSR